MQLYSFALCDQKWIMELFLSAMLAMCLSFVMTILRRRFHIATEEQSDDNDKTTRVQTHHFDNEDVFVETFLITVATISIVRMINLRDFFNPSSR